MKLAVVGGHMAPALGFLQAVASTDTVVYIGRQHVFEGDTGISLEQQTITRMGIRFVPLRAGRVQRKITPYTIPSLLRIPQGFFQAYRLLRQEKPDVVVGFGGYLSVPIGIAASLMRIPLVIHESTLGAGLANKLLAPFAQRVCISWNKSRKYFPTKKVVLTGDPMLPFDAALPNDLLPKSKEKLPLLVVSGGSGGAHAVNTLIEESLPQLLEKVHVLHLTGDAKEFGDFDRLQQVRDELPKKLQDRYRVVKFIAPDVINSVFAASDVVVGRSGFNTVMTMLALKKKMLCIPLVVGQKNEQLDNAKLLVAEGLGDILPQNVATPQLLLEKIQRVLALPVPKTMNISVEKNGGEKLYTEVALCIQKYRKED